MTTYRVRWEIEVEASGIRDAARMARAVPATVCDVRVPRGDYVRVDLGQLGCARLTQQDVLRAISTALQERVHALRWLGGVGAREERISTTHALHLVCEQLSAREEGRAA